MEEEKEPMKEEEEEKEPQKSSFKWIILVGIVVFLGIGGFFGWSMFMKGGEGEAKISETREKPKKESSIIFPLDSFIVNLMDKSGLGRRYLKVTMKLEVSSEKDKERVKEYTPQIRDTVLLLLSSMTFNEINSMEGKIELKESLLSRINRVMGEKVHIKKIYFSEFVVQ